MSLLCTILLHRHASSQVPLGELHSRYPQRDATIYVCPFVFAFTMMTHQADDCWCLTFGHSNGHHRSLVRRWYITMKLFISPHILRGLLTAHGGGAPPQFCLMGSTRIWGETSKSWNNGSYTYVINKCMCRQFKLRTTRSYQQVRTLQHSDKYESMTLIND